MKKLSKPKISNVDEELKKQLKEKQTFFSRQIAKMYANNKAPDYLVEDQPGEHKVPCKHLIQKVKEDTSSIGLSG